MFVKTGSVYQIKVSLTNKEDNTAISDANIFISIRRKTDDKYFNGMFWSDDVSEIFVDHVSNGNYIYEFTPTSEDVYVINKRASNYPYAEGETIQVFDVLEEGELIKITNKNLLGNDSTDTTILDINQKPMPGVKISCYNTETKSVEAVTQSDENGCWEMIIKRGTYFFMFEKDGYITTSFERSVE